MGQLSDLIDRAGIPQSTGYSSIESLHSTMLFIKAFFYEAHVIIGLMWPELFQAQCNKKYVHPSMGPIFYYLRIFFSAVN